MKNEQEKSDPSIVAKRPANKPDIAEVDLWGSGAESAALHDGGTFQNRMGGNARWESPRWKIRSFNVLWWRC